MQLKNNAVVTVVIKCSAIWAKVAAGQAVRFGKIALHLLFGWSLDKDEKSLDQSKQFS